MAEQKESSVLFSLKELMSLEENRIKEEEQEKDRREEAERRAAEERRLREEEDARRAEELRKKEEATRLEAIRLGEIEKAKAEAEHQARMQALAAQQAHQQQMAALASDSDKKRLKLIVGIVSAVLVVRRLLERPKGERNRRCAGRASGCSGGSRPKAGCRRAGETQSRSGSTSVATCERKGRSRPQRDRGEARREQG
jgi:colicin import membrane protein